MNGTIVNETEGHMERDKSKLFIGATLILVGIALLSWALVSRQAAAPSSEAGGEPNSSAETSLETTQPADTDEETAAETATISFTSDGFSPAELSVKKGTIVTIVNNSSSQVQFSSDDHPTHRINEGMNLPVLAPGESDSFVAEGVGEWGFHDHIDASFTGMITVTE